MKPGMTREELIGINAEFIGSESVLEAFTPTPLSLVISSPMDTMTYLALQSAGLPQTASLVWRYSGQRPLSKSLPFYGVELLSRSPQATVIMAVRRILL